MERKRKLKTFTGFMRYVIRIQEQYRQKKVNEKDIKGFIKTNFINNAKGIADDIKNIGKKKDVKKVVKKLNKKEQAKKDL